MHCIRCCGNKRRTGSARGPLPIAAPGYVVATRELGNLTNEGILGHAGVVAEAKLVERQAVAWVVGFPPHAGKYCRQQGGWRMGPQLEERARRGQRPYGMG